MNVAPMSARLRSNGGQVTNRILRECRENGSYTLSAGTMDPAIVLRRLLEALVTLDSETHRRLTGPGSPYSAIPAHAIRDELSNRRS